MILVSPTAFKGTLSASEAASAMAAGAREACGAAETAEAPVSDGGPGLIDALRGALGGEVRMVRVHDPLGRPVDARVLLAEFDGAPAAVVESADACGLHLLTEAQLDPLRLGSHGVGELIAHAAAMTDTVVLGLGGSATVEGGAGLASALGWRLLDRASRPLEPGGAALLELERILGPETSARRPRRTVALADVQNPLLGPLGAAAVFAPQKGAAPADVARLEAGLDRLARVVRRDLSVEVAGLPGGGAAGGLGAAAVAFLNADLLDGSEWVLRAVGFDAMLSRARLVVTGEGSWDEQSTMGKITGEVVERARRAGVSVLLVAGRVTGQVPRHVTAAAAPEGAILDADDVRRMVAREVARMAPSLGC